MVNVGKYKLLHIIIAVCEVLFSENAMCHKWHKFLHNLYWPLQGTLWEQKCPRYCETPLDIFTDSGAFKIQNNLSTAVISAYPKRDQLSVHMPHINSSEWVTTEAYTIGVDILAPFPVTLRVLEELHSVQRRNFKVQVFMRGLSRAWGQGDLPPFSCTPKVMDW